MRWLRVREPNLYGYRATLGPYTAEVVRAYAEDWRVFVYTDGRQLTTAELAAFAGGGPSDFRGHNACQMARRSARLWLEARAAKARARAIETTTTTEANP